MKASVLSDRWYRVLDLRPKLRANARVDRQQIREATWFLLSTGTKAKTYRLSAAAWSFFGRCDGERSVQQIWDIALAAPAEAVPTQGEVVQLLTQLYQAGLIEFEQAPDVELMIKQTRRERRGETLERANPLSFQVPLFDPSALLRLCQGLARRVFSMTGLYVWTLLMLVGIVLALVNLDELGRHTNQGLVTARNLLLAWFAYPVIKLLHELGHALALIRWGGQVREAGLGLFMLLPIPYADLGESGLLGRRHQRALVHAAGILTEMALAVLGLLVFLCAEAGLLRDAGFMVACVSIVSTVLFNANPLVRLDGYHLLCNLTGLPNLASRSGAHWRTLFARQVLRIRDVIEPQLARGERRWLLVYAPAAWIYRLIVVFCLLAWTSGYHPVLGFVVGALSIATMIVLPAALGCASLLRQIPAGPAARGAGRRLAVLGLVMVTIILMMPLPDRIVAQGVVWLPDAGQVRSPVDGFLVASASQQRVSAIGDRVVTLDDPGLAIEHSRLLARHAALTGGLHQIAFAEPSKGKQTGDEIVALDKRIGELAKRREALQVTAELAGRLTVRRAADLPGQFIKAGETIGYMIGSHRPLVRIALAPEDASDLTAGVKNIAVRLAQLPAQTLTGRLVRGTPAAADRLPSAVLGDRAGGGILVDPNDKDGTRALAPVHLLDIEVSEMPLELVGGRAWVRFDYGWSSAASQGIRYFERLIRLNYSTDDSQ